MRRFASHSTGTRAPRALRAPLCALLAGAIAISALAQQPRVAASQQAHARAFAAARRTLSGATAATARARAWAQASALGAQPRSSSLTATWLPLGPGSIVSTTFGQLTGRVSALALDPNDTTGNTLYVGTTGGGVWKSTSAAGSVTAMSFTPLTDTLAAFSQSTSSPVTPSLSIGALAVQPASTAVLLAGTGDPNDATDSYYGEGILRSADGGATWTLDAYANDGASGIHTFAGLSVAGLAWSTATPSLVVAAFTTSPQSAIVGAASAYSFPGVYYSTDAGATWQMASLLDGASVLQSPSLPRAGHAVTSVVWDAQRHSFYAAVRGHGYYASADGITWQRMANQPGTNLTTANCPTISGTGVCPLFRGTLAVQPATGDLYAWTVDASNVDQGLWQGLCSATSGACANSVPVFATRIDNGALDGSSSTHIVAQGDYNLSLAALPATGSGTLLLAGGVDLNRCALSANATSCTWRNTTNALNGCNAPAGVAPAQHALVGLLGGTAPLVWLGNDGGLWRSTDGIAETGSACSATDSSHFDNLNAALGKGGSLAEVVGFAQSPTNTDVLIAGLGANGSAATTTASTASAWTQLSAGEGGYPAIDPNTPNNWFATTGAGVNLTLCANGGSCTAGDFTGAATIGEAQVSYDASLLDAPTVLDPALTTNLLTGTCRVWRGPANSGALWSTSNAISAPLDGSAAPCTAASPLIRSLAAGGPASTSSNAQNAGSQVIYAGLAGVLDGGTAALGGHLFRTTTANSANNATAWTDIAKNPVSNDTGHSGVFNPDGFDISSVTVDPHDATGATVYATVMGLAADAGTPHVYRSTDFGAHWANITGNLPGAPASALVVDPNDANTVYVATDTGVYATQAVSTCATTSCWSQLGTGLPNAPVTSLAAGAKLPTGSGSTGMLRAGTYGRGVWQIPLLAAVSTAQPGMSVSTASLTFATQSMGSQSAAQTVTVTSNGTSALNISTLAVSGDFTETDNCAHQTLAAGASCTVSIIFAPTAQGARAGTLTVYANISGGQATVALTGTGSAAASIVLTPTALTFAATTVNATSAAQIITVANTGGSTATLQTPVLTGDFSLTANTCSSTLAASTACAISVAFTPTAAGPRNGTLSIGTSAGTQTATLTGTGNAPATDTLAPLSLTFGQQILNTSSTALPITLTNTGDTALTLVTATSSGSEFPVVSGCGTSLAAHATCTFNVSFVPSAVGARTGTLTIGDQFRTQTVALTGTGLAPAGVSLAPNALAFGATGVGLTAAAQSITLTNNGGATLNITGTTISSDFAIAASTCGVTLAPSVACTLSIVFAPKAAGQRSGALTLTDNAGTQTVALSGTGIDFSFTSNGATSATLSTSAGSATYPLVLSSDPSVTTSVSLACSGAPAHTTCTVSPSSTTLGSTINVSAVVETGVASAMSQPGALPWSRGTETWLALLGAPCLLLARRRRFTRALVAVLAMVTLLTAGGCGSSRTIPTDTTPITPTPAGTYNLSVSATSAGVTHTVALTLVVQ